MGCSVVCCCGQERQRGAIAQKSGKYRLTYSGLGWKTIHLVSEFYVSVVETCWPLAILFVCLVYLVIYVAFAGIWWTVGYYYGDFDNVGNTNHTICLYGVEDFPSALLYSIETLTSIGYGGLYPNPLCPPTIPLVFLESTAGFWCETVLLTVIFVKLARPKGRRKTLLFSKHACICKENGELQVQIRVGDVRKSHLLNTCIKGMLIKKYTTDEGYVYPLFQHFVELQAQGMDNMACLIWPLKLTHTINETSPFWDIKPSDTGYELIVFLEGTVESSGETCQARTSYTASEFLWGYEFMKIEYFDSEKSRWHVDFKSFDKVAECDKIISSACDLTDGIFDVATFEKTSTDGPIETVKNGSFSDTDAQTDDGIGTSNCESVTESVSVNSCEEVLAMDEVSHENQRNTANGLTADTNEMVPRINESTKM